MCLRADVAGDLTYKACMPGFPLFTSPRLCLIYHLQLAHGGQDPTRSHPDSLGKAAQFREMPPSVLQCSADANPPDKGAGRACS